MTPSRRIFFPLVSIFILAVIVGGLVLTKRKPSKIPRAVVGGNASAASARILLESVPSVEATLLNEVTSTEVSHEEEWADEQIELEADPSPSIFNFHHHTDLDLEGIKATLLEAKLEWPPLSEEFKDDVSLHNLSVRELQALGRVASDPQGAIEYFQAQVNFEEDKMVTRAWMDEWHHEREQSGGGGEAVFTEMLPNLSDRHFKGVVMGVLQDLPKAPSLTQAVVEESVKRSEATRLQVFAFLADQGELEPQTQRRVVKELQEFIGRPLQPETRWSTEVESILGRSH